jgi:catechol 2,3-dioxygenase-like lactoylglutathione lyase family enzyme
MAPDSQTTVSADSPESPVQLSGTDHVTAIGSTEADTVAFYRDLLGMPLVLRQMHLGNPDVTHLFFDTGDGRLLSFFVTDDRETRTDRSMESSVSPGIGHVQHLAFSLERAELESLREALESVGHDYDEFDRGMFYALYTRDPNGLILEFDVAKWELPADRRAEVLAHAHAARIEAGADYVRDEHMGAAIEELGIDAERIEVPDAPAGRAV